MSFVNQSPQANGLKKNDPISKDLASKDLTTMDLQDKSIENNLFQAKFLHPKYWSIWGVYGLLRLIIQLPYKTQLAIGASLGWAGYHLARNRRHVAKVNINLCFPCLDEQAQKRLLKATFRSTGIGIIETANSWLGSIQALKQRFNIIGQEHLELALAQGKGVLLVGMHASTLDLCGAVLSSNVGFDVMYRQNKNPFIEAIMKRGREKRYPAAIQRDDIRGVLKSLKAGRAVWYGPDQDYGRKHSVFAPFFNIETATITATARFAKLSGAAVIMFTHHRIDQTADSPQYRIELSAPLTAYPQGNHVADAALINSKIEADPKGDWRNVIHNE
ncbi:MAG: lipid A biosynthesis lauroyl acyltransferase [Moraxellaceae bacterium]|nr:MAG: lipid A biosynthesis lauroyl acyltransferase [Moraxellaceae bacterium]